MKGDGFPYGERRERREREERDAIHTAGGARDSGHISNNDVKDRDKPIAIATTTLVTPPAAWPHQQQLWLRHKTLLLMRHWRLQHEPLL